MEIIRKLFVKFNLKENNLKEQYILIIIYMVIYLKKIVKRSYTIEYNFYISKEEIFVHK